IRQQFVVGPAAGGIKATRLPATLGRATVSAGNAKLQLMNTTVLDREMFSEAEAARLLRVPQSTLHWWLDGGIYRDREYRPVIRIEPTGARSVTWAEFVEAGLLREYRRKHGVALSE